jgi:hypothetical protein
MWEYLQSYPQKNFFYHNLKLLTNNSSCRRRCVNLFDHHNLHLTNNLFRNIFDSLKSLKLFDGDTVWFKITKEEANKYKKHGTKPLG